MRVKLLILTLIYLFFGVSPVFAIDPPSLISPQNNSIISSGPTFSWQSVPGSVEYNILIDDEPTITSPYAKTPYYPTNPSYSPQSLNPGIYYWKVKTKDGSRNWSNWSNIWSFTLQTNSSSPTPTPTPTPSPTPTQSPSPKPTPSSSFTISNIPSQINSDQSFSANIDLFSPNNPNTKFYLKGAFKKGDSTNYFGLTKVSNLWIKNGQSYSEQFPITTNANGKWSGSLEIQSDSSDLGFTGSGDYIFKIGQYNSKDTSPSVSWSNEITIKINSVSSQTTSPSAVSPTPTPTVKPSSSLINFTTSRPSASSKLIYQIASIAGISKSASPSAIVEIENQKQTNPIIWVGLVFIFTGIGILGYIYIRKIR